MSAPESLRDEVAAVLAEHLLRRVTCGDEWIWECAAPECVWMDSRDPEGLDGHRTHLADALLASPALARVIREAKAEAWDEGHLDDCLAEPAWCANHLARNPCREEQP